MKSTFATATPVAPVTTAAPVAVAEPIPADADLSKVPAVVTPTTVVPRDTFFDNEALEGEYDKSDLQIPGLNLVQSVGPLSEHFQPGQMIYNKEDIIDAPVEISVLKARKFYQEKLPYGSDVMPRRFATQDEGRAAGLVPLVEKNSAPAGVGFFEPVLDCTVLIGSSNEKHQLWPLEHNGKRYAMARFFLKSIAYSATGKLIISTASFALQKGLHTGYWHITPKREKVGTNMVWIPRARLAGKHDEETANWIKTLLA